MKTVHNSFLHVGITMFLFLVMSNIDTSYSGIDERMERISRDATSTFSPGYVKQTEQKSESVLRQQDDIDKGFLDDLIEYTKSDLTYKVDEDSKDKVSPELKKKTSATSENQPIQTSSPNVIDSAQVDIDIGSGIDKTYDGGRLISEVIDGRRYVYAGFDSVGKSTIQGAIDMASVGDTVVVKAGTYYTSYYGIQVKDGVSLYGGYSEDGTRDIVGTPTIIEGDISAHTITNPIEINGLTLSSSSSSYASRILVGYSSNVTIINCIFNSSRLWYFGISVDSSSITVKNSIFNTRWGISLTDSSALVTNNNFNGEEEALRAGTSVTGSGGRGRTEVVSSGNNFYGTYWAITVLEGASASSANDYFRNYNPPSDPDNDQRPLAITNVSSAPNVNVIKKPIKDSTSRLSQVGVMTPPYHKRSDERDVFAGVMLNLAPDRELELTTLATIFKALLKGKSALLSKNSGDVDEILVGKLVTNLMDKSALSQPIGGITDTRRAQLDAAILLANILKNPSIAQKEAIEMLESLMNEVERMKTESGALELEGASDELFEIVGAILLAQAIPDLLKEGDITNIRNIFSEFGDIKDEIMMKYQEAAKPYYDEMVKLIVNNITILQLKGILSNDVNMEELYKFSSLDIGKIIERIKASKDRTPEEDVILLEEAKLKTKHIEPARKALEEDMKSTLKNFTKQLYSILEGNDLLKDTANNEGHPITTIDLSKK